MKYTQSYFLTFALFFVLVPLKAQWDWLNPLPFGSSVLDIHMSSDSLGFFIYGSGLYRTDDGGDSWNKIRNMAYPNFNEDMDFGDGVAVIVGRNGTAHISLNEGNTWVDLSIPANEDFNTVDIISADTIIVSSASHIYLSYDRGVNWRSRTIPLSQNRAVKAHFISGDIGHVAGLGGYLLRTLDGGMNWDTTATSNTTSSDYREIYFVNRNFGYAVREFTNVNVTRDGGNTWTKSTQNFRDVYSIEFIDDSTGFFVCDDGIFYKTIDGGEVWEGSVPGGGTQDDDLFAVSFIDKNIGFIAGRKGRIMKTNNGGQDWQAFSPYYYTVSGITFPSQRIGYAIGYETILKTIDEGNTWVSLTDEIEESVTNVIFFNEDTGLVSTFRGQVFKTNDGGQNWVNIYTKIGVPPIHEMFFVNQDTGFISGDRFGVSEYLEVTYDGGGNWTRIRTFPNNFDHLHFIDTQLGFGISTLGLYKTSDGGFTWEKDSILNSRDLIGLSFPSDSTAFVLERNGLVFKTSDQGNSWDTLSVHNDDIRTFAFQDEMNGFVTADFGKYFYTTDGGDTWTERSMVGSVYSSCIAPGGKLFIGGANGLIARNEGFSMINSIYPREEFRPSIKIYPNPNSGNFYIETEENQPFGLKVYDLNGKLVFVDPKVKNPYINMGDGLNGIFLVIINIGESQYSGKIIIR